MKAFYQLLKVGVLATLSVQVALAQKENVGIGTVKPDQSALLDLTSTNKGLLMPRVTLQQRNSIQNPANGLIVYQTDMLSGFYYFDGSEWKTVGSNTSQNSIADDPANWSKTGNAGTTAANFLGTTDNVPLTLKVNNVRSGYLSTTGPVFFGYNAGGNSSIVENTAFGYAALQNNTTGVRNAAIGYAALLGNTTGEYNFGIGFRALFSNTTGIQNMAIGNDALYSNNGGSGNLAVGTASLNALTSGLFNVGVGYGSLLSTTNGNRNTAIGYAAMLEGTTGDQNVAIGAGAGRFKSGGGNIFIGYEAGRNTTDVLASESNKLYIANSNTATPLVYGDFTTKYLAVGEVATADRAAATSGGYRLLVKGGMITEKIKVAVAGSADWADYVFDTSYRLMPLDKVESFVKENKHLPNVPSAEEMSKNGLDVVQTSSKLMEKIEELTLYMIELNKEVKALKIENEKLRNK